MTELKEKFEVQLLSKGSFIDDATGTDKLYLVETYTVRLNYVALNEWILSKCLNQRECYETDEEWEAHVAEYKVKRSLWNGKVTDALDIDPETGSVSITQAQSEIFAVVHIRSL